MNIRVVARPNGSCEIVRVLDQGTLRKWKRESPLAFESSIVWLQPIEQLDFVRCSLVRTARTRRGPLEPAAGLVLGYSTLTADAPLDPGTRGYVRRLFYLEEEDSLLNMNQFPRDALDPRTVLPGVTGQPPNLFEIERGYPWYLCRAGLDPQAA